MATPSDIIRIYSNLFSRADLSSQIITITGIYQQDTAGRSYNGLYYDRLQDEHSNSFITATVPQRLRDNLTPGNLIEALGTISINPYTQGGQLKIQFHISSLNIIQHQAIPEEDAKRFELRVSKQQQGLKPVESNLETKLMQNLKPRIALLYAQTTITDADFMAGISHAALEAFEFQPLYVNFSRTHELVDALSDLDVIDFDAIAIIRGGGAGIENLDAIPVLERILTMNTPIIGAVGHVQERLFFKDMVDWLCPTPNGLAQNLSLLVERVSRNRQNSEASIRNQIQAQFQNELNNRNAQIATLTQQINQQRNDNQQTINHLNEAHQREIQALSESNNRELTTLNLQIEELKKKGSNVTWMIIAIIAIIIAVISFFIK